jgi:hypothetical protein
MARSPLEINSKRASGIRLAACSTGQLGRISRAPLPGNRVCYEEESGLRASGQFIWRDVRFLRSTYEVCALTVSRT